MEIQLQLLRWKQSWASWCVFAIKEIVTIHFSLVKQKSYKKGVHHALMLSLALPLVHEWRSIAT